MAAQPLRVYDGDRWAADDLHALRQEIRELRRELVSTKSKLEWQTFKLDMMRKEHSSRSDMLDMRATWIFAVLLGSQAIVIPLMINVLARLG